MCLSHSKFICNNKSKSVKLFWKKIATKMFTIFNQLNGALWVFSIFLLTSLVVTSCYKKIVHFIKLYKIPGPKRHPLLGNLLDLAVDHSKRLNPFFCRLLIKKDISDFF